MSSDRWLAAMLPVLEFAAGSLQAVCRAARRAGATSGRFDDPLKPERIAAAFASDRLFRHRGTPVATFAPLSGYFETRDGWVRTHANYPHHAHRLTGLLGLEPAAGRDAVVSTLARCRGSEIEEQAARAGAIVVRVRTESAWQGSAQAPVRSVGFVDRVKLDGPRLAQAWSPHGGSGPLDGVRVLDLTRVIAGPVCTRTLALLGATVLRVDPPHPAEIAWQHLDTGQGKYTTILDLRRAGDRAVAQRLLDHADVLVTGYRPGAIEAFGLRSPPGLVHARITAWGRTGPWADRRGFDSIVQAACGIALIESLDGGATPGALPAQALDHATGYHLAAAIIDALVDRAADGRGRELDAALIRTAQRLLELPGRATDGSPPAPSTPGANHTITHAGVTTARPALPGYEDFPFPAHALGSDPPTWPA